MIAYYLSIVDTEEDTRKIEYIYEKFYSYMCYTAGEVLHHKKADVEDAVHSAMLKIIENIDRIDTTDDLRTRNLCGIIARNKAIDFCRQKSSQTVALEEEIVDDFTDEAAPESLVIGRETYDVILRAVEELDDLYRDVCILKYVHQFKEREIGKILDIPPNTVSTRIFRGKKMIREALRKENLHV